MAAKPRKPRDYAAEYQSRQKRAKQRYGVTYNELRRLVSRGTKSGLKAGTVREALVATKGEADHKLKLRRIIDQRARAREARLVGEPTLWDPFEAECINVDSKGDVCGHLPQAHNNVSPHPCTECTCPEYIHPGGLDIEVFWYH